MINPVVAALQIDVNTYGDLTAVAQLTEQVATAAALGAQIVVLPEFGILPENKSFSAAAWLLPLQQLAQHHAMVIAAPFYEISMPYIYSSVVMIDVDGSQLGNYRRSHSPPADHGLYASPLSEGNSGLRVWHTQRGCIGMGIGFDVWFPECARMFALQGADIVLFAGSFASEVQGQTVSVAQPPLWQTALRGHALCNHLPMVVANWVGHGQGRSWDGHSVLVDQDGNIVSGLENQSEGVAYAQLDVGLAAQKRLKSGFFNARREDLYRNLVIRAGLNG